METSAVCLLSHVPLRKEPSERSEMASQLLFGDLFRVLESRSSWIKIRMTFDAYEGWVSVKQAHFISDEDFERFQKSWVNYVTELTLMAREEGTGIKIPLVLGSQVPRLSRGHFKVGPASYGLEGKFCTPSGRFDRRSMLRIARKYIGAPYLWGGRSPFGIDCSGLTQQVLKMSGINLPRDAWQQALTGESLDFLEESLPGDLAFFDDDDGNIIHTGIITGTNTILHASGLVRNDMIDHHGIFDVKSRKYTHKLRIIRRYLPV